MYGSPVFFNPISARKLQVQSVSALLLSVETRQGILGEDSECQRFTRAKEGSSFVRLAATSAGHPSWDFRRPHPLPDSEARLQTSQFLSLQPKLSFHQPVKSWAEDRRLNPCMHSLRPPVSIHS